MPERDVKRKSRFKAPWDDFRCWVDKHPRTGWYITGLLIFNTLVNVLELFR